MQAGVFLFFMDLTDAQTVRPIATKFGMVTHTGQDGVSIRSATPPSRGKWPQRSRNFGTAYTRAQSMGNNKPNFAW